MTALSAPYAATTDVHVTGRRVLATLIDSVVVGAAFTLLAAGTDSIEQVGPWEWVSDAPPWASVLYAVAALAYFVLMEGALGQTLGKMATGIRVVDERTGATPPGYAAAAIRTVLRVVDGLLGYLVAFVVVLSNPRRQRLGDMAAHTLVVRT
ncbi:RDD family protein [Geodermatophilus arenarius]|uniref:RDD family protein n=1 Tax=Geodermatophilus arenarius TaxID=1137990 RepID=A0ABV9LH90_9ACTN